MINLLPPQQKQELLEEKKWNLVLILEMLVLIFLLCSALIFFSVKIYIAGQLEAQKILVRLEEKALKTSESQDWSKKINTINQELAELTFFYQGQANLTNILEMISGLLPAEISLSRLSIVYLPSEKEKFQINLIGYAPTREVLLEFKTKLEARRDFKDIYIPPTNWVSPTNINFNLNFKIQ